MNKGYTTDGSVRGTCGHVHKTIASAMQCLQRDRNSCGRLGGGAYSDRDIVRLDGGELTGDDIDALDSYYSRLDTTQGDER